MGSDRTANGQNTRRSIATMEVQSAISRSQQRWVLDVSDLFELEKVVSWEKVSDRMGKVRTAVQCSHHWRHVERGYQMRTTEDREGKRAEKRAPPSRAVPKSENKPKKRAGDIFKPKKASR